MELNSFARQWRRAAVLDPEWEDPYKLPEQDPVQVAAATVEQNKKEVR